MTTLNPRLVKDPQQLGYKDELQALGMKTNQLKRQLSRDFLEALLIDFGRHGADAVATLREMAPDKYCNLIAALLPKEATLNVNERHTHEVGAMTLEATARLLMDVVGPQPHPVTLNGGVVTDVLDITPELPAPKEE